MNETYNSPIGAKMQSLIYDCDKPKELAIFYAKLLGGKVESDPYGAFLVTVPNLSISLGFQLDEYYQKPVWLGSKHDRQPMLHIDLNVENREKAIEHALSIGAVMPKEQFCQSDWDVQWTTLLDPAGHPFCLFDE